MTVRRWMIETDALSGDSDVDRHIVKVLLSQPAADFLSIGRAVENPSHTALQRLLNAPSSPEESVDSRIDVLNTRLKICEAAKHWLLSSSFDEVSFERLKKP
jgi:hypothetical protein